MITEDSSQDNGHSESPTLPPNTGDTDIDTLVKRIMVDCIDNSGVTEKNLLHFTNYNLDFKELQAAITKKLQGVEKAYGGCHKCYGKGYATVIASKSWSDTDTDIGSPGGSGHSDRLTIKYCTCDRGKQLEALTTKKLRAEIQKARIGEMDLVKLVTYREEMVRYAAERTSVLQAEETS